MDGTNDRLIFAMDQTANLPRFDFVHPSGMNGTFAASQIALGDGFFEIVPSGNVAVIFQAMEARREGGNIVFVVPALAGQRSRVLASEDLIDGFPLVVATFAASPSNTMRVVTDSNGGLEAERFYRVVEIGPTD